MSINIDCGGCVSGDHDKHNYAHGLLPRVIGGTHCGCQGDCAERAVERAEAEAAEFAAKWLAVSTCTCGHPGSGCSCRGYF